MSNVPLMFQPLVKYAQFEGRSRRSEFWLWVLFRILIGMVAGSVMSSVLFSSMASVHTMANMSPDAMSQAYLNSMSNYMRVMPIFSLINLALLVPSIAVGVRRLHDTNRTGWWMIMPIVVAIAGVILFFIFGGSALFSLIQAGEHPNDAAVGQFVLQLVGSMMLCLFLPMLIAEIVMLVFYVTDGTPGPNRFGPDPKGRGAIKASVSETFA